LFKRLNISPTFVKSKGNNEKALEENLSRHQTDI
jgi:hypothetical protein